MNSADIIDVLDIRIHPFAMCDLVPDQPLALEEGRSSILHHVLAGTGDLLLDKGKSVPLSAGTVVLVPSSTPHVVRSGVQLCETAAHCRPIELGLSNLRAGGRDGERHGDGTALLLLCSHVDLTIAGMHNVLHLHDHPISADISARRATCNLAMALLDELTAPRMGSGAMIDSLVRIATIQLLREEIATSEEFLMTISVCREPKLMPAIRAMLENPKGAHTVESLAGLVAMSRSGFASKFKDAFGMGPMEFLRRHRVDIAARRLQQPFATVERASETAGFGSRSAFARAFREVFRVSPREFKDSDQ